MQIDLRSRILGFIISVSFAGALPALAQDADPAAGTGDSSGWSWSWDWATGPAIGDKPGERDWGIDVTPYLWLSGIDGRASYPRTPTVSISATFDTLASSLDLGAAGFIDLRFRRWHLMSDNFWVRLKDNVALTGGSSARAELSTAYGTVALGYELPLPTAFAVDLYLGARWWNQTTDLSLQTPIRNFSQKLTEKWADAVGGARVRYRITDSWRVAAVADIGGGDSKFTWTVQANVGYDINRHLGFTVGYRVLGVDYRNQGFVYDVTQQGLLLGIRVGY